MIALLMIAVVLVGAVPALATPPDIITLSDSGTFTLAVCDGFDVIDDYDGWFTIKNHYDRNGDLVRSTYHATMRDRIYNSVTGFDVGSTFAYNSVYDPDTNEYFIRGAAYEVIVPAYGPVYFDAGLGIFVNGTEVRFVGNFLADEALLCSAMNQ